MFFQLTFLIFIKSQWVDGRDCIAMPMLMLSGLTNMFSHNNRPTIHPFYMYIPTWFCAKAKKGGGATGVTELTHTNYNIRLSPASNLLAILVEVMCKNVNLFSRLTVFFACYTFHSFLYTLMFYLLLHKLSTTHHFL